MAGDPPDLVPPQKAATGLRSPCTQGLPPSRLLGWTDAFSRCEWQVVYGGVTEFSFLFYSNYAGFAILGVSLAFVKTWRE